MERSPSRHVVSLARSEYSRLRAAVVIPTFSQILNELVQNALDAGASRIECWISLEYGNEMIRVEDNGHGLDRESLHHIGRASISSKDRTGNSSGPKDTFGFRGEALAAISGIALLEITSKTARSRSARTKVVKNRQPVFEGQSKRSISGSQGTSVTAKDIFHNIPVRYTSLASTPSSTTIRACKRVIEDLALVRPNAQWIMWEEKPSVGDATSGPKKLININGGETMVDVYRSIYGRAMVERVQNIRVSSDARRIDGFISLHGAISQNSQHLYVDRFPLDRNEIHAAIAKRFASSRFSKVTQDDIETPDFSFGQKRSPRRLERYPIYVLNVTLPSEEVDVAYDPGKRILGHRDIDTVKTFVLAVVDQFLRRHGFVSRPQDGASTTNDNSLRQVAKTERNPSPSLSSTPRIPTGQLKSAAHYIGPEGHTSHPSTENGGASIHSERSRNQTPSLMAPPQLVPLKHSAKRPNGLETPKFRDKYQGSGLAGDDSGRSRLTMESSGKRHKWIDDIVSRLDTGVMRFSPAEKQTVTPLLDRLLRAAKDPNPSDDAHRHTCNHTPYKPSNEVSFSTESLANATILGQVDTKFIACLLESPGEDRTLVLVDQHAADERVSIEAILQEFCEGFVDNTLRQTGVSSSAIVLTHLEAQRLALSGYLDVIARWGISLDLSAELGDGDYVQVPITAVPTMLASRLARKEGSEMTRLVRLYLDQLDEEYPEISSFLGRIGDPGKNADDWQKVQRWMPKEMLELANSKACRNAIMFQDPLDLDQCKRLVHRLSKARSPWICAHGRPSMVPLGSIGRGSGNEKRYIDWMKWDLAI